jgi:hypothetical protein
MTANKKRSRPILLTLFVQISYYLRVSNAHHILRATYIARPVSPAHGVQDSDSSF